MIVRTQGVIGGRARIDGTRMAVHIIKDFGCACGYSPADVVALYPHLTIEQVTEALEYAKAHPEEMAADRRLYLDRDCLFDEERANDGQQTDGG